jgi:hypothetical protein
MKLALPGFKPASDGTARPLLDGNMAGPKLSGPTLHDHEFKLGRVKCHKRTR